MHEPPLSAGEVFRSAIAAGVKQEDVLRPWLEACLSAGNVDAAREAVEVCAPALRLSPLDEHWSWPTALKQSRAIRSALHLAHYYLLDDAYLAAGRRTSADAVLEQAIAAFPEYSGPTLRLAERRFVSKDVAGAGAVLSAFLRRSPGDLYAAITYARYAANNLELRETTRIMRAAVRAGARADALVGPWLDVCFARNDASGVRSAISATAVQLGLPKLHTGWTWREVLGRSEPLRRALHITHYYALADGLLTDHDQPEAEGVLAIASRVYPTYSGPILKLADLVAKRGAPTQARRVIVDFLKRIPNDLHCAIALSRMSLSWQGEHVRRRTLAACVAAGVPASAIAGHWIGACFSDRNFTGARRAVEVLAEALTVDIDATTTWLWAQALDSSPQLCSALHLTHFYALDEHLVQQGDFEGANNVLRSAARVYPAYSGPVLRLAERLASQDLPKAELIVAEFVRRTSGDLATKAFLDRAARTQANRQQARLLWTPKERSALRARIRFCSRLHRRGRYGGRPRRVIEQILQNIALPIDRLCVPALPGLFAAAAFDRATMERLILRLDPTILWDLPADPDFDFVKATLAFHRHDFSAAKQIFRRVVSRQRSEPVGVASQRLLLWLINAPHENAEYMRLLRRESPWPDLGRYSGKRVLIMTDVEVPAVEDFLGKLPPTIGTKVVFSHSRQYERTGPIGTAYDIPSMYVWYGDQGKSEHKKLEIIADAAASELQTILPALKSVPWALRTLLIDHSVFQYFAIRRFADALKSEPWDEVLVFTRIYHFFLAVREIGARYVGRDSVQLAWADSPSVRAAPSLLFWPDRSELALEFMAQRTLRQHNPALGPLQVPVLPETGKIRRRDTAQPAIVSWSIGDRNYDFGLTRVVGEILQHRPVIIFTVGDTNPRIASVERGLIPLAKRTGNSIQILRYDTLLKLWRSQSTGYIEAMQAAIERAARRLAEGGLADFTDISFMHVHMAFMLSRNLHLGVLLLGLERVETILSSTNPAYLVTAPGRMAYHAAVAERLQSSGIDCMDVHLYFLADHARQLQPPHRYIAVVDSMMHDLVCDMWGTSPADVKRVGYVWKRIGEQPDETVGATAQPVLQRRKVVLLATQPAPMAIAKGFITDVLATIASIPDVGLLIKPHPREETTALDFYRDSITRYGLADRVVLLGIADIISPLIRRADVIVTRTSNVGLEAAENLKPVIRYVHFDTFLPKIIMNAEYAKNAHSVDELYAHLTSLLNDETARQDLAASQAKYFEATPALLDAGGPRTIAEFMEELHSRRHRKA